MKKFFTIVGCVVGLSVCVPASAAIKYSVTDLGVLPVCSSSTAYGINNAGQVVGYCDGALGSGFLQSAFLWSPSTGIQSLGDPPTGFDNSRAHAINNAGQVTGYYSSVASGSYAYLWTTGTGIQGISGGLQSRAHDISDVGEIVGEDNLGRAFIWSAGSGLQPLGSVVPGNSYRAQAVNEDRQIAGFSSQSLVRAILWSPSGAPQDLGTLPGGEAGFSRAHDINSLGHVVGCSSVSTTETRPFLWTPSAGMVALGNISGCAEAINDSGNVVGWYDAPFLWTASTGRLDLNSLIDPAAGWVLMEARDINASGQIVGFGNHNGVGRAYLLSPVPEPSSTLMLAAGVLALFAFRRFGMVVQ